jgi:hypothetical protein
MDRITEGVAVRSSFEKVSLNGIHLVFIIAMTLGFEAMAEGVYKYWRPYLGLTSELGARSPLVFFLPIITMVLLGFRFLWATINIRRYISQLARTLRNEVDTHSFSRRQKIYERRILFFHAPALIFHGFAYYVGATFVADIIFESDPSREVHWFIEFYIVYQAINAIWLWSLIQGLRKYPEVSTKRESAWIANNLITSFIGASVLVAAKNSYFDINIRLALIIACSIFCIGSFVDLYTTTYHYLESAEP